VQVIDDGDPGFATTGAWTHFVGQGVGNDVRFSAAGNGNDAATWTFHLPEPGLYRVAATWTTHRNRATNSPFSINGSQPIRVNQEQPPGSFVEDGIAWHILGDFQINGTELIVTLTDQANEYIIADAIRVERITVPATTIIDDGQSGFTSSGNWTRYVGQGRDNDVHFSAAGSGADSATWTYRVPVAGRYRVSASWSPHPNRATDTAFTIQASGGTPVRVTVDQQQIPNDFFASSTIWKDLAIVEAANGAITVTLTDAANGYVIADAVRFEYLSPLSNSLPVLNFGAGLLDSAAVQPSLTVWQNPLDRFDVDNSGFAAPLGLLILINELNQPAWAAPDRQLPFAPPAGSIVPFLDVNGDGLITPLDAVLLTNQLNSVYSLLGSPANGEGEAVGDDFLLAEHAVHDRALLEWLADP
jgi:hypothetical protein